MKRLIRSDGGGGIVVSLYECLQRYASIRSLLASTNIALPADPRELREWSLVMALTGVLNAIDRGLLPEDVEVVIHASGSYGANDYTPISPSTLPTIRDEHELAAHVVRATAQPVGYGIENM
jgi:hypothetical protein